MNNKAFLSIFYILWLSHAFSQNKDIITTREYPQGYFRSPLNITPDASGTFGELRSTHFHAGDDYRTQQKTGLPLFAIAEGHISRIRVQIGGGGNSVYIDHPNGFTSVYLHMEDFNDALTNIVRIEQYKQRKFDVDISLEKDAVTLKKGDIIGRAGNTGASGGPHLHFEIRDTKSQNPLNTQLFGLRFQDQFPPTIQGIMIYDLKDELFNEHTPRRALAIKANTSTRYSLTNNSPIQVNGKFGLGIRAIDRHRAGGFQNGVYSIELFVDAKLISSVLFEKLDFNTSRGIHSYIDYPHWMKTQAKFQKSFKDLGNPISNFHHLENQGVIELMDNLVHDVKYVVKDVHGNCSEMNFKIQNNPNYVVKSNPTVGILMKYDQSNSFEQDDIKLDMPKAILYSDLDFVYSKSHPTTNSYSAIHHVHNPLIPLFSSYQLKIKPINLPEHLQSKALIVSVQSGTQGGKFEDGWVSVNTRNLGSFYITVDTIAPTISARNLTNGKNVATQAKIDFTISDNSSGIQSFNGYINDKWVLMEYDPKNKHLWHRFDKDLIKGTHQFKLIVRDWKDNEKIFEANFVK